MRRGICLALAIWIVAASAAWAGWQGPILAEGWASMEGQPLGERIALWADRFVGAPYDPDPQGEYVTRGVIVADERVDCMYLVFRATELAMGGDEQGATLAALDMRFITHGALRDGVVVNYDERYQYAIDMLRGGRWGRDVTSELLPGGTVWIEGARGIERVEVLPRARIAEAVAGGGFRAGDIVYLIKDPSRRVVGEIVGHMGIVKVEAGVPMLIHAGGRKGRGGEVVKLPLAGYAGGMPFIGIIVGRFEGGAD